MGSKSNKIRRSRNTRKRSRSSSLSKVRNVRIHTSKGGNKATNKSDSFNLERSLALGMAIDGGGSKTKKQRTKRNRKIKK